MSSYFVDFIAGWVGGIFCLVTGYPFDTIKVRQQTFSTSLLVAVKETYQYEGIYGFFKGMTSPLIAYGPSNAIFFGFTGLSMKYLNNPNENNEHFITNKKLYLWNYFLSGCVGAFFQSAVMCPAELIKIVLQTNTEIRNISSSVLNNNNNNNNNNNIHNNLQFKDTTQTFKTILKYQGFKGLYRGFVPMLIRDVPTGGIYFVVYEGLLPDQRKDIRWYHKIWAGGLAGIASISTVLPADVVKTRLQSDDIFHPTYKGVVDCSKKLYNNEGFRIFWKGFPIITARAFPAHAMLFLGYEKTLDLLS